MSTKTYFLEKITYFYNFSWLLSRSCSFWRIFVNFQRFFPFQPNFVCWWSIISSFFSILCDFCDLLSFCWAFDVFWLIFADILSTFTQSLYILVWLSNNHSSFVGFPVFCYSCQLYSRFRTRYRWVQSLFWIAFTIFKKKSFPIFDQFGVSEKRH